MLTLQHRALFALDADRLLEPFGEALTLLLQQRIAVARIGDVAYVTLLRANRYVNQVRARMGYPYWSLSAYAKHKVKSAVNFISEFEEAVVHQCHKRGFDGVVCGHIHKAEIREIDGVHYYNCGDWIESCSAIAEPVPPLLSTWYRSYWSWPTNGCPAWCTW